MKGRRVVIGGAPLVNLDSMVDFRVPPAGSHPQRRGRLGKSSHVRFTGLTTDSPAGQGFVAVRGFWLTRRGCYGVMPRRSPASAARTRLVAGDISSTRPSPKAIRAILDIAGPAAPWSIRDA